MRYTESDKQIESLDDFSKILLATQTINYLANNIDRVTIQSELVAASVDTPSYLHAGIESKKKVLSQTVSDLSKIAEYLGNFCNGSDIVCPIDERATNAAFEILNGKDNVDE